MSEVQNIARTLIVSGIKEANPANVLIDNNNVINIVESEEPKYWDELIFDSEVMTEKFPAILKEGEKIPYSKVRDLGWDVYKAVELYNAIIAIRDKECVEIVQAHIDDINHEQVINEAAHDDYVDTLIDQMKE